MENSTNPIEPIKQEKNLAQKFKLNSLVKTANNPEQVFAEDVAELCDRIGFIPKKILQVGAANSGDLEFMRFVDQGATAILFEPNPDFCQELYSKWGGILNITIFNLGIYKQAGKFKFVDKWASTCLVDLADTPALLDEPLKETDKCFYANCAKIEGFDNGDIDLLYLDCQGAEWYCLEQLKSRPKIISVEIYYIYSQYINPFLQNIYAWMLWNGYTVLAKNETDLVLMRNY